MHRIRASTSGEPRSASSVLRRSTLSRRDVLSTALAMGAVLLLPGCRSGAGSRSDLDAANTDLRRSLDHVAATEERRERLRSIADRLGETSEALLDEHERFLVDFEQRSTDPNVGHDALAQRADEYLVERADLRDELVQLQGELRAELTADEWDQVIGVLNRTASSAARTSRTRSG